MSRILKVSFDRDAWDASVRHLERPSLNVIGSDPSPETKFRPAPKDRVDELQICQDEQYARHLAWESYQELAPSGCFECVYTPDRSNPSVFHRYTTVTDEDKFFVQLTDTNRSPFCVACSALSRPRPWLIDSGASFHIVDPMWLTAAELASRRPLDDPIEIKTAGGLKICTESCTVHIRHLHTTVNVILLEGCCEDA